MVKIEIKLPCADKCTHQSCLGGYLSEDETCDRMLAEVKGLVSKTLGVTRVFGGPSPKGIIYRDINCRKIAEMTHKKLIIEENS